MWKCPQCETVNKEDKCIICGEPNPYFPKVTLNPGESENDRKLISTMRGSNNSEPNRTKRQGSMNGMQGNQTVGNNENIPMHIQQHTAPTIDVMAQAESFAGQSQMADMAMHEMMNTGSVPSSNVVNPAMNGMTENAQGAKAESIYPGGMVPGAFAEERIPYVENVEVVDDAIEMNTPEKSKKKKSHKALIITIIIIVVCVGGFLGFLEIQRARAGAAYETGDFNKAKSIYSTVSFYRDSVAEMKKCDYAEASKLLKKGKTEEAREIFERLDGYSDSDLKLLECDYANAMTDIENDRILDATKKLLRLDEKSYKDSNEQLKTIIPMIYDKGVQKYREGNPDEAKQHFEAHVEGCKRVGLSVQREYKSYLTLIEAKTTKLKDISGLYTLINFEDTKEILLSDKYILKFLTGEWRDGNDNRLSFIEAGEGITHSGNLPYEGKGGFSISDGIQSHGSDEYGWIKAYKYSIVNKDTIKVYCYANDETYTMYRQ